MSAATTIALRIERHDGAHGFEDPAVPGDLTIDEVTRRAEGHGQALVREAQLRADEQKRAADDYAAEVMQQLEAHLVRTVATVRKAQETLKKPAVPAADGGS